MAINREGVSWSGARPAADRKHGAPGHDAHGNWGLFFPFVLVFFAAILCAPRREHLLVDGFVHAFGDQFLDDIVRILHAHVFDVMPEVRHHHVALGNQRDHLGFIFAIRVPVSAVQFALRFEPILLGKFTVIVQQRQLLGATSDLIGIRCAEPFGMLHDLGGLRTMRVHGFTTRTILPGGKSGLIARSFLKE